MNGRVATAAKRPSALLLTLVCLSLAALLPGCTDVRRAIGMDRTGPDEFAVESRAPLTLPPDFELRPPSPGSPRPQEATAADRARKVIDTAGPGEPGKQASAALKPGQDGSREPTDATQQVGPNSLAGKLLGSGDSPGAAATRQTTPMKGVY